MRERGGDIIYVARVYVYPRDAGECVQVACTTLHLEDDLKG